jgi:D-beta-D-heptose 7-phosphate kinase/D-beta-D-heptose 1-phosphate adenosyltransferase
VKDVTGSGDIVLTVISYMYLQNKDIITSAKTANYIAGKGVETIGNYYISKNNIDEYIDTVVYDNETEKIKMIRNLHKNIVFTNGCFDLIHSAHIRLLRFSKKQGDVLVVGLNANDSIKRLKGDTRPINDITERCELLQNLGWIDYIIIFEEDTPYHILELLRPDVIVKGGDYKIDSIVGKEFAKEVILYNYINGISSTNTINKINLPRRINTCI